MQAMPVAPLGVGISGRGPAGQPMRVPAASVGIGTSSVPYGPTNGYATPNGVTGFIGPAAGSLQQPTAWYVRVGGSDTNGGSSTSLTPERTGTDGVVTLSSTTFASASANFTSADVGKGIYIFKTAVISQLFKIVSVVSSTTVTLDRFFVSSGTTTGYTWNIGGAWATPQGPLSNSTGGQSAVRSGDTVYIGAGTYRATLIAGQFSGGGFAGIFIPGYGISLVTNYGFNGQVNVVGDVTGQYTGDAGMVQLTAYTTNDKTAPSSTTLLNLNGKSNLAFSNIMFVGGGAITVTATTLTSQNITFRDCAFIPGSTSTQRCITATCAANTQFNWLIDRCILLVGGAAAPMIANFAATTGTLADYNINVVFQNSSAAAFGAASSNFLVTNVGTLTNKGNGLILRNCSIYTAGLTTTAAQTSLIFPSFVTGCFIESGQNPAVSAGTSGQIIESYNLFVGTAPRTNVNVGTGSISDGSYAPLFHFGQERIWGALQRMFGEPMSASPLLSFGNDGGQTAYDLANRPRPEGGGSGNPYPAVGALERDATATQSTSPAPPSGTHVWQNTGPWSQPFLLPVSNTPTTVSISVQRDSAYSPYPGGTLPALQILANGTLGIPAQIIVDTGATGGWNTLTAQAFTPSGNGWVTVRLVSYDGSGASVVSFADFSIT